MRIASAGSSAPSGWRAAGRGRPHRPTRREARQSHLHLQLLRRTAPDRAACEEVKGKNPITVPNFFGRYAVLRMNVRSARSVCFWALASSATAASVRFWASDNSARFVSTFTSIFMPCCTSLVMPVRRVSVLAWLFNMNSIVRSTSTARVYHPGADENPANSASRFAELAGLYLASGLPSGSFRYTAFY
jgi:hypothetical protein